MGDAERPRRLLEVRDVGERYLPSIGAGHIKLLQRAGVELRVRDRLHHHPVLVGRRIDRRDLLLVVRVRESILDRLWRHT